MSFARTFTLSPRLSIRAGTLRVRVPHPRAYSTQQQPLRPCPKCSTPLPLNTTPCPSCSTLLPLPSGLSPHSLFSLSTPIPADAAFSSEFDIGLELSKLPAHGFEIDVKDLRQRFLQRQRDLHPDKFGAQGERVLSLARELSGRVNEGYGILNNPLKRAEYILTAHALAVTESEQVDDPSLLLEVLEAREELESVQSREAVDELRVANHGGATILSTFKRPFTEEVSVEKVERTIAQLTEAFSQDPPNLAQAKGLATQLKYWIGLEEAAKEWQPKGVV